MGKKKIPPKLTNMYDPQLEQNFKATSPGQAHFAGTGPAGETCFNCAHWGAGGLRPSTVWGKVRCAQFKALAKAAGPPVPGGAWACRHFDRKA